jgi:hypothetical protein
MDAKVIAGGAAGLTAWNDCEGRQKCTEAGHKQQAFSLLDFLGYDFLF